MKNLIIKIRKLYERLCMNEDVTINCPHCGQKINLELD